MRSAFGDLLNQSGVGLGWLASVHADLGQPAVAGLLLVRVIGLKRSIGNLGGAAEALADYGRLVAAEGHPEAGLDQPAIDRLCPPQ
jgi:hypothetical protein